MWGYDLVARTLLDPTVFADPMGYCRPRWVSDYTYLAVMNFRGYVSASALADAASDARPSAPAAAEPLLVVTGWRDADGWRIEERGRVLFERTAMVRPLAARPTQTTRLPDGSVRVTWDAQAYAAALVRDGVGGPLLARDRSGELLVTPSGAQLEVLLSDGLNTIVEVLAP